MARSPVENVVAHWNKLFEGIYLSSEDFYDALEAALERRQVPECRTSRVEFYEGSVFAPEREYLRVSRERLHFDVCAAPFGAGYFFSWWLTRKPPSLTALYLLGLVGLTIILVGVFQTLLPLPLGPLEFLITIPLAFLAALVGVALASRLRWRGPEDAVLSVPFLGDLYAAVFSPPSYYRIDTMLMFQSAIHGAVLEVIDGLTTAKGLRALSDDERKPVFRELLGR